MKKFTKRIEDFVCENCNQKVKGDGFTNHCPKCLWSKHVDNNPGDRTNSCLGLMKPIALEKKGKEYVLIHQCQKCNLKKKNKISSDDDFEKVLSLTKQDF